VVFGAATWKSKTVGRLARLALVAFAIVIGCASGTPEAPFGRPSAAPAPSATTAAAAPSPSASRHRERPLGEPLAAPITRAESATIDAVVAKAIDRGEVPGAVVIVVRERQIVLRKAYGLRRKLPRAEPMTADTVFDLASLTKPIATATAVMQLVDEKRLALDDPVAKHLPRFARGDRAVRVAHLLDHTSGLPAGNALGHYESGKEQALEAIFDAKLEQPPGKKRVYSDLGYIVLAELVAAVAGKPFDQVVAREVLGPLAMKDSAFNPNAALRARAAPTEERDGRWLTGEVHDPRASALGGVAGHAGLFSTADDVARYLLMLLGEGVIDERRVLSQDGVARLMRPTPGAPHPHGLGLERIDSGVGHSGFTGTYLWLDPARESALVVLASRLHPHGKGDAAPLRRELRAALIAFDRARERQSAVKTGIDVLLARGFSELRGRRVGLVTNDAARAADGRRTVDVLHAAKGVELVALFSPEHGLGVDHDGAVAAGRDRATGLPVFSLYGKDARPTRESLRDVDVLVFDLQDAGARFYTYASTLGELLQAVAEHKRPVVVLDRPNPLGGEIAGPMLDRGRESFIAYHDVPVRHGMTLGELATLFNAERQIGAELSVVKLEGWQRWQRFGDTGLSWTAPSPNLRTVAAALLYPGVALLETTNVSVGRGTPTPFEHFGAPWIDADALKEAVEGQVPGLSVASAEFTPTSGPHARERCHGLALRVIDSQLFEPVRLGITLAAALARLHPKSFRSAGLLRMLGNQATYAALLAAKPVDEIVASWAPGLAAFASRRERFLLY
jgi:uncharacterized protein YbbC (DUF1343 family)